MKRKSNSFIETMLEQGLTIALAESVTSGLATHQLSTVKGISDVLMGSVVCYNQEVKIKLLGIRPDMIKKYTAESSQVTAAITRNLKKLIKADVYIGITGLASVGGSENKNKPVGTVFYSMLLKNKIYNHQKVFRGSPLQIRLKICDEVFTWANRIIKENK